MNDKIKSYLIIMVPILPSLIFVIFDKWLLALAVLYVNVYTIKYCRICKQFESLWGSAAMVITSIPVNIKLSVMIIKLIPVNSIINKALIFYISYITVLFFEELFLLILIRIFYEDQEEIVFHDEEDEVDYE